MSRILLVLAVGACGQVENNTPQDGPVDPDSTVDVDAPADANIPVWGAYTLVTVNRPGQVRNPAVTNDGLGVFYNDIVSNPNGDIFDVFQATRNTTATNFGLGSAVANVNVTGQQARYAEVSGDGLEVYYTDGLGGQIMMASRGNTNAAFSTPISAGSGVAGTFPSISADKLSLYFIGVVQNPMGELRVATRAAVGQAFSNPVAVPLAGTVDIFSSIDISRDELFVVRAPPYTGPNLSPPIISRRASKSDQFVNTDEAIPVVDFTNSNAFNSARLAQNDTELWVSQNDGNGTELAFVSKLE